MTQAKWRSARMRQTFGPQFALSNSRVLNDGENLHVKVISATRRKGVG